MTCSLSTPVKDPMNGKHDVHKSPRGGPRAGLKSGFRCLAQAGQRRLQPQCLLGSRVTCRQTPALRPVPRDI